MRVRLAVIASIFALGSVALFADPIPYPNAGTPAPTTAVTFTGATGSSITAYFYSVSAGDSDTVSILDATTGHLLIPTNAFPNQTTTVGSQVNFTADSGQTLSNGDLLVFELTNQSIGQTFASDPSLSADGVNHALPTDDELHGAFARLTEHGFIAEVGDTFQLTGRVPVIGGGG